PLLQGVLQRKKATFQHFINESNCHAHPPISRKVTTLKGVSEKIESLDCTRSRPAGVAFAAGAATDQRVFFIFCFPSPLCRLRTIGPCRLALPGTCGTMIAGASRSMGHYWLQKRGKHGPGPRHGG